MGCGALPGATPGDSGMRRTMLRRARPLALALGLMVVGCDHDRSSPTQAALSQSVVSNVRVRPLTGQFSDRNVQYRFTATVTNPEGLVGGRAQLKTSTAEARRLSPAGPVVAQAPITEPNLVGSELRVTLGFDHPPVGNMRLLFLVVDARGRESNAVPVELGITPPPPPPPPPPPATFGETVGATFEHPRCTNCHGFKIPNTTGQHHVARPPNCSLCHTVSGWHAPAASFSFAGLSRAQICSLIKSKLGNNAAAIEDHLKNDSLVQWAINDGTVLGNLQPGGKAPPGNLGTWNQRVEQWTGDGLRCD